MARTFRRKRTAQPIAELNVTNLIDVAFTLLIIFMIATPLIQLEQTIALKLPTESKSPQRADPETKFHSVWIDAQFRYYVDNDRTPLTLVELRARLQELATLSRKPVMRIRADESVPYGRFIQVIDELKKADLMSISLDTQVQ